MNTTNTNKKQGRRSSIAALERRKAILSVLAQRRKVTRMELAEEFGVGEKTIRTDIEELSLSHPIYTIQGNGGGIVMEEGYYPAVMRMTPEMTILLQKCKRFLSGHDQEIMDAILRQFGAR